MQIPNTNYSVSTSNWITKTPGRVKMFCDILLFLSAITAIIPELPGTISKWVLFGGVVAKLLSNFISEHVPVASAPSQEVTDK